MYVRRTTQALGVRRHDYERSTGSISAILVVFLQVPDGILLFSFPSVNVRVSHQQPKTTRYDGEIVLKQYEHRLV